MGAIPGLYPTLFRGNGKRVLLYQPGMGHRHVSETIGVARGLVYANWRELGHKPTPRAEQVSPTFRSPNE